MGQFALKDTLGQVCQNSVKAGFCMFLDCFCERADPNTQVLIHKARAQFGHGGVVGEVSLQISLSLVQFLLVVEYSLDLRFLHLD